MSKKILSPLVQFHEISGIPGGHIPGAINIPFKKFMTNVEDRAFQTLRDNNELKETFKNNGIDLSKPLIASCGAGKF